MNDTYKPLFIRIWKSIVLLQLSIENGENATIDKYPFSEESELWKRIGFQQTNPITDFRESGCLGLENLVYFGDNYNYELKRILSQNNEQYPFAIVGLNITHVLAKLLGFFPNNNNNSVFNGEELGETPYWLLCDDPRVFSKLYSYALLLMDLIMIETKLQLTEFEEGLKELKRLFILTVYNCHNLNKNDFNFKSLATSFEELHKDLSNYYNRSGTLVTKEFGEKFTLTQIKESLKKTYNTPVFDLEKMNKQKSRKFSIYGIDYIPKYYSMESRKEYTKLRNFSLSAEYLNGPLPVVGDTPHSASSPLPSPTETTNNNNNNNSINPSSLLYLPKKDYEYDKLLLKDKFADMLEKEIPECCQGYNMKLQYKLSVDGCSLNTFYRLNEGYNKSLLIVKDDGGNIFGCFAPCQWMNYSRYYGNGECFVFQLIPEYKIFHWTKKNDFFMYSSYSYIGVGGGISSAFYLDGNMDGGTSGNSETFDCGLLSSSDFFQCIDVELWVFEMK